jgi:DNA polymerase III subunit delta
MKFLYGEETFLLTEHFLKIKQEFIEKYGEYSYEEFSENNNLEDFIDAFSSMSMFAQKKLIVYKGIPKPREDYEEHFQKLLQDLQTSHDVIFLCKGKPDKRKKMVKFLLKICESESFEPFSIWKINEVISWAMNREKSRGFHIDKSTAELLIDMVGVGLWTLESNLLKIETYIMPEKNITKDVVRKLATIEDKGILDIYSALRYKNKKLYSYIFNEIKPEGIIPLLGGLSSHIRLMCLLKITEYSALDNLADKIKKKRFYLENLLKDIKNWKLQEIQNLLFDINELDYSIKSGKVMAVLGLQLVLSKYV